MKNTVKRLVTTVLCMVLAAASLFSGTAEVQASSTDSYVKLNDSCFDVEEFSGISNYAELSEDGKTVTVYYNNTENDGTEIRTVNVKKLLPKSLLKKFEDGEVYVYMIADYELVDEYDDDNYDVETDSFPALSESKISKAVSEQKKELKARIMEKYSTKRYNIKKTHYAHYSNYRIRGTATQHKKGDGQYCLLEAFVNISDENGNGSMNMRNVDAWFSKGNTDSTYYLADKNGKKIVDVTFSRIPESVKEEAGYTGITTNLSDISEDTYEMEEDVFYIVEAGSTILKKVHVSGTAYISEIENHRDVIYDKNFFTVTKNGKISTKNRYGITSIGIGIVTGSEKVAYSWVKVIITDGSEKMEKALIKAYKKNTVIDDGKYYYCTLTVNKDGSYTTKKTKFSDTLSFYENGRYIIRRAE
jgi:hypothetical protein